MADEQPQQFVRTLTTEDGVFFSVDDYLVLLEREVIEAEKEGFDQLVTGYRGLSKSLVEALETPPDGGSTN